MPGIGVRKLFAADRAVASLAARSNSTPWKARNVASASDDGMPYGIEYRIIHGDGTGTTVRVRLPVPG